MYILIMILNDNIYKLNKIGLYRGGDLSNE